MDDQVIEIDLWSGNRTSHRRDYERDVLLSALRVTRQEFGDWKLIEHTRDYPGDLEAETFRKYGHDLFVTTAGNKKLSDERKIVVYQPIQNDLLGYRVLIIREEDKARFARIKREEVLKTQKVGIPDSWADAELLRYNGFRVVERGSFDDMFARLLNLEFDFTTLGINEIDRVFAERADEVKHVVTVNHLLIYYPLPLLFYVNPDLPELAKRIEKGIKKISENNTMSRLFFNHNRDILKNMDLNRRNIVRLKNPNLPREIGEYESEMKN